MTYSVETDNLSQLVARILNQLAISAWLPSAALVLAGAFLVQLGVAARAASDVAASRPDVSTSESAVSVVATALEALGKTSIGGAVLMIATVVVLTMLTQAFTFEAIRVLEGYWGTTQLAEAWAARRCAYYSDVRAQLDQDLADLTDAAWAGAKDRLVAMRRKEPDLTARFLRVLEARVKGHTIPKVTLNDSQESILAEFRLRDFAPSEVVRRRVNVLRRLADYPEKDRALPTRLGNVLRHYEDATGVESIESLVNDVYDELPASLQITHDEQRGRLDLYCSMTVVCVVMVPLAFVAMRGTDPAWTLAPMACFLGGAFVTYRAAVASARYYGSLLPTIATFKKAAGT